MSNNDNNPNMNDRNPFLEDDRGEDKKISDNLKLCIIMLFILAFFRIFALEFICMINDLLSTIIVYCTMKSKAKVMAIICLITAVFGVIYEITVSPYELNKLSATSNSGVITNKDNSISQKPTETNNSKSNEFTNNPYYDNMNNNQDLNTSPSNSVNFIYCMILFNMILAILIYSSIIYFSYKAYKVFRNPWGEIEQDNLMNPGQEENNYGAIGRINRDHISGFGDNQRNNNNNRFVPFSGRGFAVGE